VKRRGSLTPALEAEGTLLEVIPATTGWVPPVIYYFAMLAGAVLSNLYC